MRSRARLAATLKRCSNMLPESAWWLPESATIDEEHDVAFAALEHATRRRTRTCAGA